MWEAHVSNWLLWCEPESKAARGLGRVTPACDSLSWAAQPEEGGMCCSGKSACEAGYSWRMGAYLCRRAVKYQVDLVLLLFGYNTNLFLA